MAVVTQSPWFPALHGPPSLHVYHHSLPVYLLTISVLVGSCKTERHTLTHTYMYFTKGREREREREREKRKREKLNMLSKRLTKKEYLLTVHLAVLWASFEPLTFNGLQQNLTCHQQQPRHRHTRKLWSIILNRAYPPFFQPYLPYAPFKLVFPNTWQVAHAHTHTQ